MANVSEATRSILVVVDLAAGADQPVLRRAAWLAERTAASLELFACVFDADVDAGRVASITIPHPSAREEMLLRHRRTLETYATPLRERGLSVVVSVAWDYPLDEAVVKRTAARRPWLVAKATHHHNLLQRTLLSNVDWLLIRDCPAPLLLVKDRVIATQPNVVAAIDPVHEHDKPAQLDDAIYRFASILSESIGGALHIVQAISTPMGVQLPPNVHGLIAGEHERAMASFVRTHQVPADRLHVREGLPHECLLHAAEAQKADFVVMGAVARSGLKKVLIGSTASRVLDRLPCDLVSIKPSGFVAMESVLRESM
jgi:universal stress protein E